MITDLNKILVEWAYRTNDGKPNVKSNAKLLKLESVLKDFGWSREARAELLYELMEQPSDKERLMKKVIKYKNKDGEDKEITVGGALKQGEEHPAYEKAKQITDTDDDKPQSKGLDADDFDRFSDKNKTDDKEKEDDGEAGGKGELNGAKYLQSLDIEVPEGLSDAEINSIVKTEKEKRKFLTQTIDLMMSQLTQQRKGAGTNDLTQEEWQSLKDFTEGKGPKTPPPDGKPYDITEDYIDDAIGEIRKREGGGRLLSALGNKGAAGRGAEATTRKWIPNPDFDSSKPAGKRGAPPEENPKVLPGPGLGRETKVLKSFLMTGGLSVVTGKPLSIGSSELDHRLSLDNGGEDVPENWVWMESRFNQQKNKLSDEKLIERAEKWLSMDPEKLKADKKKKLIVNESNKYAAEHWAGIFEKGGNGGINAEMLNSLTIPTIKTIIKGFNEANSDMTIQYYEKGDGNRDRGEFVGKTRMIKRAIEMMNKKERVMTSDEIEEANKVLQDALDEIKNRERDIKV